MGFTTMLVLQQVTCKTPADDLKRFQLPMIAIVFFANDSCVSECNCNCQLFLISGKIRVAYVNHNNGVELFRNISTYYSYNDNDTRDLELKCIVAMATDGPGVQFSVCAFKVFCILAFACIYLHLYCI